jgi:AcrR family transcriptional regulator
MTIVTTGRTARAEGNASPGRRRDAELNRERVLASAVSAMLREGRNVPLAAIAAEAGVGVGTLYRSYADREALLHALAIDRRDIRRCRPVHRLRAYPRPWRGRGRA